MNAVSDDSPGRDDRFDTLHLNACVRGWQAGDNAAADALCRAAGQRLERMARRMLRGYPTVRSMADTMDVFNAALMRLLNTLRQVTPPTTRDFFNLAANHIRCELIDLARYYGRRAVPGGSDALRDAAAAESEDLELWTRLHEAVDELPQEQREVFSLTLYHGWSQVQIAEVLGESDRNVRRRWVGACAALSQQLGGQMPRL